MKVKNFLTLFRSVQIKSLNKGDVLIQKGATKREVFFIRKGLVRVFFVNDDHDEITFNLIPEYQLFANIHAVLFNEPSKFSYQAIEDTKVYVIDYDSFSKLLSENPKLLPLNQKVFGLKVMKKAFQRVESFVLLSPEERYLKYINDYPTIVNRAPDKYIANVLGVTPVSLSRIRRRITNKKN